MTLSIIFYYQIFFLAAPRAMWDLSSPALEVLHLNHWMARKSLLSNVLINLNSEKVV